MSFGLKSAIKLCRLCANVIEDTSSNDLFHKNNKTLLDQIKELTGITVKDMPRQMLPRLICGDCKDDLPKACEFRRKIIKTQCYFKSTEYKDRIKDQEKTESSLTDLFSSAKNKSKKSFSKYSNDAEDLNATAAEYVETVIKDEMEEDSTWDSDDESPIVSKLIPFPHPKTSINSNKIEVNALNKTSHTSSSTSQTFDAVFLPLKKEEDNELMNKTDSDDDSDKDALENFAADETEDPDFIIGLDLKKKYKRKPVPNHSPKAVTLKDPRKNPLFCYLCQTTLKTSHAFKVHCRKLHKGEKIFKCDFCEGTFLRVKSLIRHSRLHQGGKLFECRYCDMSFNAPTTRIHHERAKHTKDWPFLCPICGKSFITTTRGKEHMTVHTKERPYKCELCKTAYLQRNNFKKHRRSELHKNNEKKLKESLDNVQMEIPVSENKKELTEKLKN